MFAGDADADAGGEALSVIPLSSIAFFAATFGFVGVVGGATGAGAVALFVTSAVVAVVAGLISTQAFKWIRKNSVSSEVMDSELEGSMARVALEVSSDHRGKIIVDMAGAREQMTASPIDGSTIKEGERVVIVKVESGVAIVAPLGPDLRLE
ncbi:MAG: hypothetical protein F4Y27_07145 [Acidimicrobiaceae bacterium]|nr:hypothetical protein [Acidimicrobiaceae bacterium]MYG55111.1 hypothetical protein [Acidimicrobiaceae bacterium]MYJ97406.1 hypothetical protein [Acidimicrobiaceae bacterium]